MKLTVIMPDESLQYSGTQRRKRFEAALNGAVCAACGKDGQSPEWIRGAEELENVLSTGNQLKNRHILFAVFLDDTGVSPTLGMLIWLLLRYGECMEGSVGGVITDGAGELYTRTAATQLVLAANSAGCLFVGRSLTEATGSLQNFRFKAQHMHTGLDEAYRKSAQELAERIMSFRRETSENPKLLCIHASGDEMSNTRTCWKMVKGHLENGMRINEICLKNGEVSDCIGCPYRICKEYGKKADCYYHDVIVERVYPALEECSGLILLCPNYNDALGANLTAMINRLTALFRKRPFYDKLLYALIVSGCSGGDIIARQLIAALNMNKAFVLPPYFAMTETANVPGGIYDVPGIAEKTAVYAERIVRGM